MNKIIYIKIGTEALLNKSKIDNTDISKGIAPQDLYKFANIELLRENFAKPGMQLLRENGYEMILRVSGSIGLAKLMQGIRTDTGKIRKDQKVALAGLGQNELVSIYRQIFSGLSNVGQFQFRESNRNEQEFIQSIDAFRNNYGGIIPLLNENDVMDYSELDGNNDKPAASDVIYLADNGRVIEHFLMVGVEEGLCSDYGTSKQRLITDIYNDKVYGLTRNIGTPDNIEALCDGKTKGGNGGMKPKVLVANDVTSQGIDFMLASNQYNLLDHLARTVPNTLFHASTEKTYKQGELFR